MMSWIINLLGYLINSNVVIYQGPQWWQCETDWDWAIFSKSKWIQLSVCHWSRKAPMNCHCQAYRRVR